MNNIDFIENLQYVYMELFPYILKIFFIGIASYYTFVKIINDKHFFNLKFIIVLIFIFLISILSSILKYNFNFVVEMCSLVFMLSTLYSISTHNKFKYALIITIISQHHNMI